MRDDQISEPGNVDRLGRQLADYYETDAFRRCMTMGDLVDKSTHRLLDRTVLS